MKIFERLTGLETEYALRIPASTIGIRHHRDAYDAITETLKSQLPTAEADSLEAAKVGLFLGTGGVVWFESLYPPTNHGLIEGATPECRSPRDLLACQRAQDRLLGEAAELHGVALMKNCRDAFGNTYGAQESYEVNFAGPVMMRIWSIATILIFFPLTLVLHAFAGIVLLALMLTVPITRMIHNRIRGNHPESESWQRSYDFWVGRTWRAGTSSDGNEMPIGGWTKFLVLTVLRISVFPLVASVWFVLKFTELGRTQKRMVPFLISRPIVVGAGRLDKKGRMQISDKASAVGSVLNLPELGRGIFSIGQFIKPIAVVVRLKELFLPRQRIQVSIGDSNLCEEAEYLRIGTTLLVIDAIEAGFIQRPPQPVRPIHALKRINNDPTLTTKVRLWNGKRMSALEIQQWYLNRCRKFVESQPDAPQEAHEILDRWSATLRQLALSPENLVGRIDWVTKKFILDRVAPTADFATRKKIDLRYHELSDEGYFRLLATTGIQHRVLEDEEIERARRLPPGGTPATTRARLIREFSGTGIKVGWKSLSNGMRIE